MNTLRTNQIKLGKVKDGVPNSIFFYPGYLSGRGLASFYTEEENMKQSWVERSQGSYVVKTGTVTPFGFVEVRKTDRFGSLDQANKKADLCNHVWKKCKEFSAAMCLVLLVCSSAFAYTNDQIADAIFKAENSKTHPYGILTHYKTTTPRQACLNTIAHALRDWNGEGDFIEFLGSRYAPIGATNDPTNLNRNWVKNVKFFLEVK